MKLFHVSQDKNNDYDTYSDFVICCESEEIARNANPSNGEPMTEKEWKYKFSSWCHSIKYVSVVYLGEADLNVKEGIVCSSYHAG
jgi:hypothetical protein